MRAIITLILVSLISTTALGAKSDLPSPQNLYFKRKPIAGINVLGHIKLVIHQSSRAKLPTVSVPSNKIKKIVIKPYIRHKVLYIRERKNELPNDKRVTVNVSLAKLKSLAVFGSASVISKKIRAKRLVILDNSSGTINLNGTIDVKKIEDLGPGNINLRWVNSNDLIIDARGAGNIKLAGVAKTLHARILGHTHLNAQYLRCDNVWVQTANYATAEIMAIKSLRAFAGDNSNIYYYKAPESLTRSTRASGNVLQVDWR